MSKLSFRARALDAAKPMPVYMAEELPDLPDYSAINRAVPQMPSGMQKEEECEHHLQRAICAGLIIPTPEVTEITTKDIYDKIYPANYKQPRQLIHMQPFTMEQDIPDYDADSEDERWLEGRRPALAAAKFEEMMDRLEKSSGQTVVTLDEARALLKDDDDLVVAVFDYWLNKRLKTQHALILTVKTEQRAGQAPNNPYLAFRRRTEKMQTRKNRKNDEASYEKMLKLRRDLCRAVTLLELVKRREKIKREYVHLTVEVFEKRFQARDFSGAVVAEASAAKAAAAAQQRPAFTPIFHNHYTNQGWQLSRAALKDEAAAPRREKRQYKKRKHRSSRAGGGGGGGATDAGGPSSDEDAAAAPSPEPDDRDDDGPYAFKRNRLCSYHMPLPAVGNWPWTSAADRGSADRRYRFALTSLSYPAPRCVGFARRRVGRGGRVILDRASHDYDDLWRTLGFTVTEPAKAELEAKPTVKVEPTTTVKAEPTTEWGGGMERWTGGGVGVGERTSVKTECADEGGGGESAGASAGGGGGAGSGGGGGGDTDEMVEFLRSIRRDWLHFRPKTPPPDRRPTLPGDAPSADDWPLAADPATGRAPPFQMELRLGDDEPAAGLLLLGADDEPFLSDPFYDVAVAEAAAVSAVDEEVPVTDTRQGHRHPWGGKSDGSGSPPSDDGLVGVSRFILTDLEASSSSTTLRRRPSLAPPPSSTAPAVVSEPPVAAAASTSHKTNCSGRGGTTAAAAAAAEPTNGLLSQFGLDAPANNKTRNNKLATYVYASTNSTGGGVASAAAAATTTTYQNTLSLHTSAHTLTLNSHSANIFEIPLDHRNNHEPSDGGGPSLVVNSHGGGGGATADGAAAAAAASPAGPKQKAIVRKNNLIMEVT